MQDRPQRLAAGLLDVVVTQLHDGARDQRRDWLSVEQPLAIQIEGELLATTMRTPGHDPELCLGLLFSEGVIRYRADIGTIAHCGHLGDEGYGNVIDVRSGPGVRLELADGSPAKRGTLGTSACGVCGRRSIDDLLSRCSPVEPHRVSAAAITRAVSALSSQQHQHKLSGGLHAAGVADLEGSLQLVREDVGRHNAVDKAIGRLLLDAESELDSSPARGRILAVSGRTSFEIVQKAVMAGAAAVAGVSAPSTLAVETAARAGVILCGFVRDGRLNAYTHVDRLSS